MAACSSAVVASSRFAVKRRGQCSPPPQVAGRTSARTSTGRGHAWTASRSRAAPAHSSQRQGSWNR
eukprot:3939076-Rhodomonas_salina.1